MSFNQTDVDDLKRVHELILEASRLLDAFQLRHEAFAEEAGIASEGPDSEEFLAVHEAFAIVQEIDDIVDTALTPAASAYASVSKIVETNTIAPLP